MKTQEAKCPNCALVFGIYLGPALFAMGFNNRWYVVEDVLLTRCDRCHHEWTPGKNTNFPTWTSPKDRSVIDYVPLVRELGAGKRLRLADQCSDHTWIEYDGRILVARRLVAIDVRGVDSFAVASALPAVPERMR